MQCNTVYSIHIFSSATTLTCLVDWVLILLKLKFFFVGCIGMEWIRLDCSWTDWLMHLLLMHCTGLLYLWFVFFYCCFCCCFFDVLDVYCMRYSYSSSIYIHRIDRKRSIKIKQQVQVMVMTIQQQQQQNSRASSSYSRQLLL